MREAIEAAGARLVYLPPYRPDLNPIVLAFAKLKALLRKAAARGIEELEEAIAKLLERFSIKECLAYFRHCGYLARQLRKCSNGPRHTMAKEDSN